MILILFPFVGFFAACLGLLIVALWWSLTLLFGVIPPTPDQSQGVVLGVAVLSQFGVGGVVLWLFTMDGI